MQELTKTEKYDAPWFVLDTDIMITLQEEKAINFIRENEDIVDKILEKEDKDYKKMLNIFFTKRIKESLETQDQFEKINIILENPNSRFIEARKYLKKALDVMKQDVKELNKAIKKPQNENTKLKIHGMSIPLINYLKEQKEYEEAYAIAKARSTVALDRFDEDDLEAFSIFSVMQTEVEQNRTIDYYLKNLIGTYARFEITFKPKLEFKVYVGGAPLIALDRKDFRPWDYGGTEVYYGGCDDSETTKMLFEKSVFSEGMQDNEILSMIKEFNDSNKQKELEEKIEEVVGVCPYNQLTLAIAKVVKDISSQYLISAMALILENNIIEEKIEKTRSVVPNKGKKTNKKVRYKSIVKTYYSYDEEVVNAIIEKRKKSNNELSEIMSDLENENEERLQQKNYQQEEWESKSYYRKGKNGEKIKVSGSKKRRKPTLLQKRMAEKIKEKEAITLGLSKKDVKKVVKKANQN